MQKRENSNFFWGEMGVGHAPKQTQTHSMDATR